MKTIQQAWHGCWRNVTGSSMSEDAMAQYVTRAVARDGYQSFRIADSSTDGEAGASLRPIYAFIPLSNDEATEWIDLLSRDSSGIAPLSADERIRMKQLAEKTKGDMIGETDDHVAGMAMKAAYRDRAETDRNEKEAAS